MALTLAISVRLGYKSHFVNKKVDLYSKWQGQNKVRLVRLGNLILTHATQNNFDPCHFEACHLSETAHLKKFTHFKSGQNWPQKLFLKGQNCWVELRISWDWANFTKLFSSISDSHC